MFSRENIQPSINPKPITVQRANIRNEKGEQTTLLIRNVSLSPRDAVQQ